MIILQLILYCLIFTVMVRISVSGGAVNALYFYPKPYQERAFERGIADRETVKNKKSRFMTAFYLVMTVTLVLIIGVWNRAGNFKDAYLQALLFLEVMNIYDGTVIDKLWVGHSKFWIIPGMEDTAYVQTWGQVLKKRTILALIWTVGALIVAGLVVLTASFFNYSNPRK